MNKTPREVGWHHRFTHQSLVWLVISTIVGVSVGCVVSFGGIKALFMSAIVLVLISLFFLSTRPTIGLVLLMLVLPFERIPSIEVAQLSVRMSTVLFPMVLISWMIRGCVTGRWTVVYDRSFIFVGLFALGTYLSSLFAWFSTDRAIQYGVLTGFVLLFYCFLHQLIQSRFQVRQAIIVLVIISTLLCLFGLYQFVGDLFGLPLSLTGLKFGYHKAVIGFPRIHAVSLEPLFFANFLLAPIGVITAVLLSVKGVKQVGYWLLLSLLLFNFLFTLSRGGYAALLVMMMVIAIFLGREFFTLKRMLVFFSSVLLVIVLGSRVLLSIEPEALPRFIGHALVRSVNAIKGQSVVERRNFGQAAIRDFIDHPVTGVGPGNFGPSIHQDRLVAPEGGWKVANNQYLETIAETGFVGTIPFICLLLFLLVQGVQAARVSTADLVGRGIQVGLLGAYVGLIFQWLTFSTIYSMPVWGFLGLFAASSRVMRNQR